ncbi:MAG: ATP synthase subunit I [Acidocella sp.]|nr:ATP synthase subunit I [Acidocella sp.]
MTLAGLDVSPQSYRLVLWFAAGCGLGLLYFGVLWWNVRLLTSGAKPVMAALLGALRFAGLGVVLFVASHAGVLPLLAMVLGVLAGRGVVVRRLRPEAA